MRFSYPPTLATNEGLCKVHLDAFRANDEFFNGIADAWRPVQATGGKGFIGEETSLTIYDGRHLLRADSKTFCYYIFVDGGSGSNEIKLKLYYDNVLIDEVTTTGGYQYKDTNYSLSSKSPGLYRVHAILQRDEYPGGSGGLRAPYTRYTGSLSYTTPPTITDDQTSSASHFQAWRDNDLYFRAQSSPRAAFVAVDDGYTGDEPAKWIWAGYDRFHPDHYRLQYRTQLSTTSGGNKIKLYYDQGGGNEQSMLIETAGWVNGYWDLSSPGNYTKGAYYRVAAQLLRTDVYTDAQAQIHHLMMRPLTGDASYTVMDQFVAGQYVYGNTGGQGTRLSLLSSNDTAIRDRLIYADGTTGRQDYAIPSPFWPQLGGNTGGYYTFMRQHDLLYYRVQKATLYWGDEESQGLEDYDDGASHPYWILNLNSLGIPRGSVYSIAAPDGELWYAMEF